MKNTFKLVGLDCANCAAQIENAVKKIKGVQSASVSFMTCKMIVECEEENSEEIIEKIKDLFLQVSIFCRIVFLHQS